MRLLLTESPCTTITGLTYPADDPVGSPRSAHHTSPCAINVALFLIKTLEYAAARLADEGIGFIADFVDDGIYSCGQINRRISHDKIVKGASIEAAPRRIQPPRHRFGFMKHVIGDRNSNFHTKSMTTTFAAVKPCSAPAAAPSAFRG